MSNRSSLNGVQPEGHNDVSGDMTPSVITVNFGLKWKHLAMAGAALASVFTTVAGAGWLVLPAKQTDMIEVQKQLVVISERIGQADETRAKLIDAVDKLTRRIDLIPVAVKRRPSKIKAQ